MSVDAMPARPAHAWATADRHRATRRTRHGRRPRRGRGRDQESSGMCARRVLRRFDARDVGAERRRERPDRGCIDPVAAEGGRGARAFAPTGGNASIPHATARAITAPGSARAGAARRVGQWAMLGFRHACAAPEGTRFTWFHRSTGPVRCRPRSSDRELVVAVAPLVGSTGRSQPPGSAAASSGARPCPDR